MATERRYFRSIVEHIRSDYPIDMPKGMDLRIDFRLYKVTKSCWVELPSRIIHSPQELVDHVTVCARLEDVQSLSQRTRYTQLVVERLCSMHVPEEEHAAIIGKIFQVIEEAVPGLDPIFVDVFDVTLRFLDSADSLDPEVMTESLLAASKPSCDVEDDRMMYELEVLESRGLYGPEPELIPATKSVIEGLERVRFDSLETTIRQMPCSICMEALDHFALEQGTDEQLMITRLPCSHHFHGDCVVQWLETNHMCPVCRYPMPTVEVEREAGEEPSESSRPLQWNTMLMMSAGGVLTTATCFALQMVERKLKLKISDYLVYAVPLVAFFSAKFM